jgi:hypothetical protein
LSRQHHHTSITLKLSFSVSTWSYRGGRSWLGIWLPLKNLKHSIQNRLCGVIASAKIKALVSAFGVTKVFRQINADLQKSHSSSMGRNTHWIIKLHTARNVRRLPKINLSSLRGSKVGQQYVYNLFEPCPFRLVCSRAFWATHLGRPQSTRQNRWHLQWRYLNRWKLFFCFTSFKFPPGNECFSDIHISMYCTR